MIGSLRFLILLVAMGATAAGADAPVRLKLDTSEADAALAILQKESAGKPVPAEDWKVLFAAEPYRRLKMREASGGGDFTDETFKTFLSSPKTIAMTDDLSRTLQTWKQSDLSVLGQGVLSYLPQGAQIHASVYPEIKPAKNSFVWGPADDRAIFLYLNPLLNNAQFKNKVAHESHHIGIDSLNAKMEVRMDGLSDSQKQTIRWLGAFGEGEAMLAAAGSPDVHPHATDDEAARQKWDSDMLRFNQDLPRVQQFLLDIVDGKLKDPAEMDQRADIFYGDQGAWYTVGYRMAQMVEKRFGRPALIEAMIDPRKLLLFFNQAATELNNKNKADIAVWSPELLKKLQVNQTSQS